MKYLPILQELFESDTIIFLVMGVMSAAMVCRQSGRLAGLKKCITGMLASILIYAICELASNIHTNFLSEIVLLFIGTFAIGCGIGFLACIFIGLLKNSYERER